MGIEEEEVKEEEGQEEDSITEVNKKVQVSHELTEM